MWLKIFYFDIILIYNLYSYKKIFRNIFNNTIKELPKNLFKLMNLKILYIDFLIK